MAELTQTHSSFLYIRFSPIQFQEGLALFILETKIRVELEKVFTRLPQQ
jgi:hypothetical protein